MTQPRRPLDAYFTPDALATAIVGLLPIQPGALVWEPHAGGGAFVRALTARGAIVTASDINPEAPALLDPHRGPTFGMDFLTCERTDEPRPDWIVGNPPFTGFEAHVDHALKWAPNVVFLLRLAATESKSRVGMWQRWPLRKVWVLAERPSFTDGGTDSCAYGVFWFCDAWRGEPAQIVPGWSWK